MYGSASHDRDRRTGLRSRRIAAGSLAVGAATVAVLLGGCSGGSDDGKKVANVGPSNSASAANGGGKPSTQNVRAAALAYAKCMRQKGISQFPDPDANGGIAIDASKVQQNSPQFKAADDACKSLLPAPPPGGGVPEDRAAGLKYAACMRSHGVPKFPDPNAGGGISIDGGKLGVDPNGPVFKGADQACKKYMGGGGATNQQGGPPAGS